MIHWSDNIVVLNEDIRLTTAAYRAITGDRPAHVRTELTKNPSNTEKPRRASSTPPDMPGV